MRTYEVITIVLSTIKLIVELVKLYIEHKNSVFDTSAPLPLNHEGWGFLLPLFPS